MGVDSTLRDYWNVYAVESIVCNGIVRFINKSVAAIVFRKHMVPTPLVC